MKKILFGAAILSVFIANAQQKTYANPVNVDYGYTPIPNFATQGKHRATADPVIVTFKGKYFMFSTNQWGYWWSDDMLNWKFVSRKFLLPQHKVYDELCAPAVFVMKDAMYVIGSTHNPDFPIWKSTDPTKDNWEIAVKEFKVGAWDPAFHYDEDTDKLYLYWGSSNAYPILGTEINTKTLQSEGYVKPLLGLEPSEHGWERFGEYNDNTFLPPFIEGAWMTKHNGKYYLQYGAPGTEFSGYGDGVYVSDKPLEGFTYQSHNPFSYKPGGFARGAGHGATFEDNYKNWWHISTIVISTKNNFERRMGIWPAGFDKDDVMYTNTAYGDYPTYLPQYAQGKDFSKGLFAGWMLLNYQKPVQASSTLGGFQPNLAVDEDIKTYWSAKTGNAGEWYQTDLGDISTVNAIQINYADQDAEFLGKTLNKMHQYKIYASNDGKSWKTIVDKSKNQKDVPHDYIEVETPVKARFLKMENLKMPTGKFALSGFRVFGKGTGEKPTAVENFVALRAEPRKNADRRSVWFKWKQNDLADGYVIYFGKSPDKLYGSIMVYGKNEYYFTGADKSDAYYFQIEAFNANGISERTSVMKSE
ncbi:discoidin domain-containing protein [Elizabethkingia anophelis]|uniref:discoidin domain-containing protein n=1 Tax=Elizabethkingia anophelis TaxID=1117645 RepID=UPI000C9C4A72|nr:discoidin domain-containing protein [Elizabethkingia anophelis]MCT3697616.1 discoidin domain-containing protein [Elizabethkingia anophelis]MCT3760719.1 discoidin domain-containing protein [Elizabethkingia anophelis]MCT3972288.1 discoidin domain-containing protein [Elizabethkingia anophelis]MCT4000764.1 discoidin domain-containing protein [Elizabethkingia anophelis]MCT4015173.1 discoidin domain-containing protein [Elizabethkingia anophelis]